MVTVVATVFTAARNYHDFSLPLQCIYQIVWVQYLLSGMQVAVGALILQVVLDMLLPIIRKKQGTAILIFLMVFGASLLFHVSSVYLI